MARPAPDGVPQPDKTINKNDRKANFFISAPRLFIHAASPCVAWFVWFCPSLARPVARTPRQYHRRASCAWWGLIRLHQHIAEATDCLRIRTPVMRLWKRIKQNQVELARHIAHQPDQLMCLLHT